MMNRVQGSPQERRLLRAFKTLEPSDRDALLAFAEFLVQRGAAKPELRQGPRDPAPLPRPPDESVVGAIKRLSLTYEMIDRGTMLNETSALMSAHILQGRAASEVIDELEALFARYYQDYRTKHHSEG